MSDTSDLYLRVREKEGRLYADEIVRALPEVPRDHPLRQEWKARAASCRRLAAYLGHLKGPASLLEVGCGNGWLSHRLASLHGLRAWGLDVESPELQQAARLFNEDNLAFLAADIFQAPFPPHRFDVIVIASAIQYFPDLPRLICVLQGVLIPTGELHILDSPLYREDELAAAKRRTQDYYASLGFPEMADGYFHHTASELEQFSPRWLYRPSSIRARVHTPFAGPDSPFPWLCIGSNPGNPVD